METLIALLSLAVAVPAFASHAHDRVCVGEAKVTGADPISFVFQYEVGRSYQSGDLAIDPHEALFTASVCDDDYLDGECIKSKSEVIVCKDWRAKTLPAKLKSAKGDVFFDGIFTFASETLAGKILNDDKKLVATIVKLSCVSQPSMTLDIAQDGL